MINKEKIIYYFKKKEYSKIEYEFEKEYKNIFLSFLIKKGEKLSGNESISNLTSIIRTNYKEYASDIIVFNSIILDEESTNLNTIDELMENYKYYLNRFDI